MNNLKNNIRRTPRQLARREPARSCEPSSHELSSQLSSLFPYRLSVTDGDTKHTFSYHADGQLASASCDGIGRAGAHPALSPLRGSLRSGDMRTPQTETFLWDGLALIQRGDEQFMNKPHVGGGNPVASSKGTSYFNDALGTTVGSKSNGKYSAAALTAFGEDLSVNSSGESSRSPFPVPHSPFFTGKPYVEGLGHAFLMRNYRAGLAKWQTADPMGYPDGWNQLAYCRNGVTGAVDLWGCMTWDQYKQETLETEGNWQKYQREHNSEYPVRVECYIGIVDTVLVREKYRGIGIIDGKMYDVYQQYYFDVYETDVYGGTDPCGSFREFLLPAGVATEVGGIVVTCVATGPAGMVAGVVIGVAGLAITLVGGVTPDDLEFQGVIYNYKVDSMTIKYRSELRE